MAFVPARSCPFLPVPPESTLSQRAVNELARHLRFVHFDGDGCVDHG